MNLLDWAQVALSLVVMLIALYIALFGRSRYRVLMTTRVASFSLALLDLSYFVGASNILLWVVRRQTGLKRTRRWWGFWWCSGH
jgi:hypothetical protein